MRREYEGVVDASLEHSVHAQRGREAWRDIDAAAERVRGSADVAVFREAVEDVLATFGDDQVGCSHCTTHARGTTGDGCGAHLALLDDAARWFDRVAPERRDAVDAHAYAVAWASRFHMCVSKHVYNQMKERDPVTGALNPRRAYVSLESLTWSVPELPRLPPH